MRTQNNTYTLTWKPFADGVYIGWLHQEFDNMEALESWKFKILYRYPRAVFVDSIDAQDII